MTPRRQTSDHGASGLVPPGAASGAGTAPLPRAITDLPVLIIEDEAVIAWMVEDILEAMGFASIAVAASAEAAIDHARRQPPGLIVSDINLGADRLDGVTAVAQIVSSHRVPVLFVTGYAGAETCERIEQDIGQARILRKPISSGDLRRALVEIAGEVRSN